MYIYLYLFTFIYVLQQYLLFRVIRSSHYYFCSDVKMKYERVGDQLIYLYTFAKTFVKTLVNNS